MVKQRIKIVLTVTAFSMLGEYSLRGFAHLLELPLLALIIFLNYLPYFLLLEDLIGRYRLRPFQLYLIAFAFGVYWQILGVPVAIIPNPPPLPEYILGFNIYGIFYNDFIVWPLLQTVFAFYLANRLFPRPGRKALLPTWAVITALIAFSIAAFSFRVFVPNFPIPSLYQFSIMLLMVLTALVWFAVSIKRNKPPYADSTAVCKDPVLDLLGIIVGGSALYLALFLPYSTAAQTGPVPINARAVPFFLFYTFLSAVIILLRSAVMRRPLRI